MLKKKLVNKATKTIKKTIAKAAPKAAAVKNVVTKGGTSKQHAKAGRLGGLAPHICRGRECTKIKEEALLKSKAKAAKATALKKVVKAEPTKRSGIKKVAVSKKSSIKPSPKKAIVTSKSRITKK